MSTRFTFGKGENLIITTNGQHGDGMRMVAASYLTSGEARQKLNNERQPREIDEVKIKAHGRQRALFVFNMHRPSSRMLDVIFGKEKPKYVSKNKPSNHRHRHNHRIPAV